MANTSNTNGNNESKLSGGNKKREFTPEEFKAYNERMWNEISAMMKEQTAKPANKK